jgi:hypothetical protein
MDIYGMTDLSNQAVGARVKEEPDHYLIHAYGIFFEEIRASRFDKIQVIDTFVIVGTLLIVGAAILATRAGQSLSDKK